MRKSRAPGFLGPAMRLISNTQCGRKLPLQKNIRAPPSSPAHAYAAGATSSLTTQEGKSPAARGKIFPIWHDSSYNGKAAGDAGRAGDQAMRRGEHRRAPRSAATGRRRLRAGVENSIVRSLVHVRHQGFHHGVMRKNSAL
ncbi:hypothetical protein [Herbaspirillum robiniae]|uniref:hypothetical protein n=1 Tax=Herbaspirillum robiniae TaxID=2014887 RepID=UPI00101AEB99|nr:hypothetical protein [Herbaspirillum robiniae]